MRETQFADRMNGGLFLEPGAHISYNMADRFSISLECSWRSITGCRGQSYSKYFNDTYYTPTGEAAAALSLIDTALLAKVKF
jgi:hypothetical protein